MTTPRERLALVAILLWTLSHGAWADNNLDWQSMGLRFEQSAAHANNWTTAWASIYGLAVYSSAVLTQVSGSETERYNAKVRTVTASLGLIDTLLNRPRHREAYQEFQDIRGSGETVVVQRDKIRGVAERLAHSETGHQQWRSRLGSIIVNSAAGLMIALDDDRPGDSISTALLGMAVTELRIRTRPTSFNEWEREGKRIAIGGGALRVYPQLRVATDAIGFNLYF